MQNNIKMTKHLLIFFIASTVFEIITMEPDFKITVNKINILSYNKDFVKDMTFSVYQYNSTHQAINSSGYLLQDLGYELKENIEVYGVENASDPRVITTMNDVNICDVMTSGYGEIEDMFKVGNFTKCPMRKGFYVAFNILDVTNIPPTIPRGKFMVDIKSFNGTTELSHTQTFATVEDIK